MFLQKPSGYFCCEPGKIGVNPTSGLSGGLCEPADQHVPTSLLATVVSQVGLATSAPSASGTVNATVIGGGAGGATQTNPSLSPTNTNTNHNHTINAISNWSLAMKIGIGAAVVAGLILLCALGCFIKRRRNRVLYRNGLEMQGGQYDEYGNLVPAYSTYEPYRRQDGNANNVTVNVVHGDQH